MSELPKPDEGGVCLDPVLEAQAAVLRNLFELYVYDFSEQLPIDVQASGRFELAPGDQWWTVENHFPFFIRVDGKLAGFALVRRGSRVTGALDTMDVAEFFVLRGKRRQGVGREAARALLAAFPGPWEIRVRRTNGVASRFWSAAIEACTAQRPEPIAVSIDGVDWDVLRTSLPLAS